MFKSLFKPFKSFPDPRLNEECTELEVDNKIVSEFILTKLIHIVGISPFPLNELHLMVLAVAGLKPTHIFEWGTHVGVSARVFYEISKAFQLNTEIHSTDLPDDVEHIEHPKQKRGKFVKNIKAVTLHQGDGLNKSLEIYKGLTTKCKPLFFVDGDHSYSSVKRELETIIEHVPNADVLLHDTFYQSDASGYNVGPYEAIIDVLSKTPNKYKKISTNVGLPGMTLLYN